MNAVVLWRVGSEHVDFVEVDGRRLVADRDVDLVQGQGVIGDLIVVLSVEPLLFQELRAEHGDHVVECNGQRTTDHGHAGTRTSLGPRSGVVGRPQ